MPVRGPHFAAWILLLATAVPLPAYSAEENPEPIETLVARAEASTDNQGELYALVVQREIELANDDFTTGDADRAQNRVKAALGYAEKSLAGARRTKKKLKQTEILFRKISRRLNDIGHTLAIEDQPAVFAAVERLEQIRTDLLSIMFADPNKDKEKDKEKKPTP